MSKQAPSFSYVGW